MHLECTTTSGPLPTSEFELIEGHERIGKLQLRHRPSKSEIFPKGFENHIYYEIYLEFRGKGYGTKLLALGLEEARKFGIRELILACTDENIPSQKIIEKNGGELMDTKIGSDGTAVRKYRIAL